MGDNYNLPISPSQPPLHFSSFTPANAFARDILFTQCDLFLQTRRKRLLPVLKELAGSQGFNDWGPVQWWGGEARGSVRTHPPHPRGSRTDDSYARPLIPPPPLPYYRYSTSSTPAHPYLLFFLPVFYCCCSCPCSPRLPYSHSSHIHVSPVSPLRLSFLLTSFLPFTPGLPLLPDYLLYSPFPLPLLQHDLLLHFTALVQLKYRHACI